MARPTEISCEDCGATVRVKARGRIPTRCDDCRAPKPPADAPTAAPVDEQVVDDGWPKRIAPVVWVDQKGRRYRTEGAARAGAAACRS